MAASSQSTTTPGPDAGHNSIDISGFLNRSKRQPIFTRERIDHIAEMFQRLPKYLHEIPGGKSTFTCDLFTIFGEKKEIEVDLSTIKFSDEEDLLRTLCLSYHSLQYMADSDPNTKLHYEGKIDPRHHVAICPTGGSQSKHNCSTIDDLDGRLEKWEATWKASALRESLIIYLKENYKNLQSISSIACFGLGSVGRENSRESANYTQHLAARDISEILTKYLNKSQPIPTIAQDPEYCENCIDILRGLGITTVSDPTGFQNIDENTLVYTISPNVPVRQIVTDMLLEQGGPLAMFCDKIEGTGMEFDQKRYKRHDVPSKYNTDPTSPNVVAYKNNCTEPLTLNDFHPKGDYVYGDVGLYVRRKRASSIIKIMEFEGRLVKIADSLQL